MALQNAFGNLALDASLAGLKVLDPDQTLNVSAEATSLFVDDFSGTLVTNWVTGGTAPTSASGQVTFASSTNASAVSTMRTSLGFPLRIGSYVRYIFHVRIEAAAVANTTRFWGVGTVQGSPTADLPLVNGLVFELRRSDGALYAVTYSAGTRTEVAALGRPADGGWHRYELWYRQARSYWTVDGGTPVSTPFANLAVAAGLYAVAGQINHSTAPSTAPTMQVSAAGVADHSGTVHTIGDGTNPTTQVAVKPPSTAAAATDPAMVVVASPNQTAIPVGNVATIGTSITPGTSAAHLGKARGGTPGTTDTGVAALAVRAPTTPAAVNSAGLYVPLLVDAEGKPVTAGTADPVNSWQGNITQTSTTAAAIKAAGAAGIRNYLTDLSISNASATATTVQILDGSTVIWQQALAAGAHIDRSFTTPLRGTAATALNVNLGTAVTSVYFSASGYLGV